MVRPHCCDKMDVKKGVWTVEEDAKMLAHVSKHGIGNWTAVPKKAGLKRCGKSCRLRYTNYLRPDLKHDSFSSQEEELIIKLHSAIGSRWAIIAQQLPGRTDNDVKNHWNTKLRKKLSEMGIDPVTHKPFSQILSDYGNLGGGLPKGSTRVGSLSRDLKNAFISKSDQADHHHQVLPVEAYPNTNTHFITTVTTSPNIDINQSSHSLDLLAELQAIKLATEAASNCRKQKTIHQPHLIFNQSGSLLSPSSSCSSSTCSTAGGGQLLMSPQDFCWQDFLLEEALPPANDSQDQQGNEILLQSEFNNDGGKRFGGVEGVINDGVLISNSFEAASTSSCDASFVEAMLKQDNEMLLMDFPTSLLEDTSHNF